MRKQVFVSFSAATWVRDVMATAPRGRGCPAGAPVCPRQTGRRDFSSRFLDRVWLPNHRWMALPRDLEEIEKAMATRGLGPHPAVVADRKMIDEQLDLIYALISRKVAIERYRRIR